MKAALTAQWALSPSSLRRAPTNGELASGFPCGPADRPLFNELMNRLTQHDSEIGFCITESGQTPSQANLEQLWEAIQRAVGTHSPQRLAFDQYFTDDNPTVVANTHFDTDGDAGTLPVGTANAYEYTYTTAFPGEKTLINVVMIHNFKVQRPGTANIKAYVRARATNAAGVNRNNFVTIESRDTVVTEDWKSLALSMLVGKFAGTTTHTFQLRSWWSEETANVGGDPYRIFLDDCEWLIIERVVDDLPTFTYAD